MVRLYSSTILENLCSFVSISYSFTPVRQRTAEKTTQLSMYLTIKDNHYSLDSRTRSILSVTFSARVLIFCIPPNLDTF